MTAVADLADSVGTVAACAALGVSRAAVYRKRSPVKPKPQPRAASPRALDAEERQAVLDALHSTPLADKAPAEAYATLLDEGKYYCSTRTMYRILNANKEVRERRDQLRHPTHAKPQLKATTPNQVWSWDITKLLGPKKWIYFHLYVVSAHHRHPLAASVGPERAHEKSRRRRPIGIQRGAWPASPT
jgi:putative transposase